MKILVVDDEADIRELCETLLRAEGFEVLVAEDVPGCLERATSGRPDMILLDWMLPGQDGMQGLVQLKSDPRTASVPVVMCTAFSGPMEINLARHHGADGYLAKPFEADDLLGTVHRVLYNNSSIGSPEGSSATGLPE